MRKKRRVGVLGGMALAWGLVGISLPAARADVALNGVNVTYHGGALIQHAKVALLLYGSSWQGTAGSAYLQGFLQTLFADGRFMANLAQYSAGGFHIGNGSALDPMVDPAALTKVHAQYAATGVHFQVTDEQIQAEIKAQITAHKLAPPDADTLYVVCCSADVVVINGDADSENDFDAYHDYDTDLGATYAVICPTGYDNSRPLTTPTGEDPGDPGAIGHHVEQVVIEMKQGRRIPSEGAKARLQRLLVRSRPRNPTAGVLGMQRGGGRHRWIRACICPNATPALQMRPGSFAR